MIDTRFANSVITEGIADLIRDAGMVLAAFLSDFSCRDQTSPKQSALATGLQSLQNLNVKAIELGSGCGIVGLQLAYACPQARLLLTDLPEAMEILEYNVIQCNKTVADRVETMILDWDEDLPQRLAVEQFGLILISDCTYNSDSIPSLVRTLAVLATSSPSAVIVVSLKVRHESEAIFHELMLQNAFEQLEHFDTFHIPDRQRSMTGQELDIVHIYVYRKLTR